MLKTVSSIANAIGALNYKGTWDANANSPALTSSVGTKGDYYVVGTAGATNLNGISNWGIGDWAVFNGAVWQRVEGGANLNGVDLSVSGTSQLTGNATFSNNLVQGTAAKGVNFTANTPAAGMTSQLLNWYEEGTWTPVVAIGITSPTYATQTGTYTRIGNTVFFKCYLSVNGGTLNGGQITLTGLPFTASGTGASASFGYVGGGAQTVLATSALPILNVSWSGSATTIYYYRTTGAGFAGTDLSSSTARWDFSGQYTI